MDTADIQHIIGKLGHLSFDLIYSSDIFSINLVTLIVENTSQCDVTLLCLIPIKIIASVLKVLTYAVIVLVIMSVLTFKTQHGHRFFHQGVHVPFYLHFWGYIQIFGGAMYLLTLHLGVQRKLIAFSPCKVVHHAVFGKYYAE